MTFLRWGGISPTFPDPFITWGRDGCSIGKGAGLLVTVINLSAKMQPINPTHNKFGFHPPKI